MRTLKKIHLKSVSEFLSDQEMKSVVGGVTYSNGYVINGDSITYGGGDGKCMATTDLNGSGMILTNSAANAEDRAGEDGWWCCNCDEAISQWFMLNGY